jgi:methyl coenzyme M reductase subunit D
MGIDVQRRVRDSNNPELPSDRMKEKFEFWEEKYTVENLTDLTASQIKSRRLQFENEVHRLVAEHNPGKGIEGDPVMAAAVGKPAYTKKEWEQARKMIWNKKDEITLRFDQAEGKVKKDRTDSKMEKLVSLVDSVTPNSISISLG